MMKSQTKMQSLILTTQKIAKGLNKFTIDDILQLGDFEETDIKEALSTLEEQSIVKKLSDTEYLYVKMKPIESAIILKKIRKSDNKWLTMEEVQKLTKEELKIIQAKCESGKYISKQEKIKNEEICLILKTSIEKNFKNEYAMRLSQIRFLKNDNIEDFNQNLFKNEEEQKVFDKAPDSAKLIIIKFLTVFKMLEKLQGRNIRVCLEEIAKQNNDYEIKYTTFMRKRKNFIKYGIKSLIPQYGKYHREKTNAELKVYEDFKRIYLTPNGPPMERAIDILTKYGYKRELLPCIQTFKRMLMKEFSREAIYTMRQPAIKIPNIKMDMPKNQKNNKVDYETFMEAAEAFLKIDNKNNVTIHMRGYLKNHLIPYFKNFRFDEITQEDIIRFQSKILAEGFSSASVGRIMSTLSKLYRTYAKIDRTLSFSRKNTILTPLETRHLQNKEILEIIKNNCPELWIICLGINLGELLALSYEDIDFKNKTIKIDKMSHKNEIQVHRRQYRIRTLKLPSCIFKFLDNNKPGPIFKKINIKNYDILLNTHIHLMLEKNIQINLISKNLGYKCLNDFEARFNFMLQQSLDENFEII